MSLTKQTLVNSHNELVLEVQDALNKFALNLRDFPSSVYCREAIDVLVDFTKSIQALEKALKEAGQ